MRPGIIGRPRDPQVRSVASCLRASGSEPLVLDPSRFPARAPASIVDGVPSCPGVDVAAVAAWYIRGLPQPLPFQPLDAAAQTDSVAALVAGARRAYAAGRERRSFLASFVGGLERGGATLVNPPAAARQHFLKLEQIELLRAAGVPVPRTLATNDPQAVVAFAREVGGPLVYKPLAGGGHCRRVDPDDLLPRRLRALATAPVLFQEEVPGRNIRVYVVGGEVAAAYEIVSDAVDYRGSETAVHVTAPTAAERAACETAARACEMRFTGIDLRRRADASFAVLECNPSPMFATIERRTGATPVSAALAGLLTRGSTPPGRAAARSRPRASAASSG